MPSSVPSTSKPSPSVPATSKPSSSVPATRKLEPEVVSREDSVLIHHGRSAELSERNVRPYIGQPIGVRLGDSIQQIKGDFIALATVPNSDNQGRRILDRAPWTGLEIVEM